MFLNINYDPKDFAQLGREMKQLESECDLVPNLRPDEIVYFRLDGKNFSKLLKSARKPYDVRVYQAFYNTVQDLFSHPEFDFDAVYIQSDEISLLRYPHFCKDGSFVAHKFSGRVQKLLSHVTSLVSVTFAREFERMMAQPIDSKQAADPLFEKINALSKRLNRPERALAQQALSLPTFDCRMCRGPLAPKQMIWRAAERIRSSKMSWAQHFFSPKELHKIGSQEAVDMVDAAAEKHGIDLEFSQTPEWFRKGCLLTHRGEHYNNWTELETIDSVFRTVDQQNRTSQTSRMKKIDEEEDDGQKEKTKDADTESKTDMQQVCKGQQFESSAAYNKIQVLKELLAKRQSL